MQKTASAFCLLHFAFGAALLGQSVELKTLSGTVHGTLLAPAQKAPVVLIIAGSGPTDRDGNSKLLPGANNSLRLLAERLAANGIASLRYDKRGIGASAAAGPSEADLRFDTYIDDAAGWCAQLKKDKRFTAVYILGHSEGSLIGMNAAQRCGAAGFISIAGAGRPAGDILRSQLAGKLPPELAAASAAILKGLEEGKTAADVPPALNALYRPSVQPYMISWLKHDPAAEIARLNVPVLVIQGTADIQVAVEDARRLAAANPKARLLLIEGMNHVLKRSSDLSSYGDPSLPLAPELTPALVEFVQSARPAKRGEGGPAPRDRTRGAATSPSSAAAPHLLPAARGEGTAGSRIRASSAYLAAMNGQGRPGAPCSTRTTDGGGRRR